MAKKTKRTKKEERRSLNWKDHQIPLLMVWESRNSIRMALAKTELILRLPSSPFVKVDLPQVFKSLEAWLEKLDRKKPGMLDRFREKKYETGQLVEVGKRVYSLDIRVESRQTHSARLRAGTIELRLSDQETGPGLQKKIQTLLSRVVAIDYLPEITQKIHRLNQQFFQKQIKSISLRYTHGRWGSCSRSGNINLSTRLLFAPEQVVDYVIIHELAHLVEHNHSARYWKVVERVMPDYLAAERWLKENGHTCDF